MILNRICTSRYPALVGLTLLYRTQQEKTKILPISKIVFTSENVCFLSQTAGAGLLPVDGFRGSGVDFQILR